MKKFFVTLALALTMLMVIPPVCTNDAWTLQAEAASKKTIKLNKTSLSIVDGKSYTLVLKYATASKVKWTTSNKNIATVSKKGVVTAKKPGTVTIIAKYKGKQYKCKVTVKQPQLNKSSVSIVDGKTYALKLKNAITDKVKWTSSDKTIATESSPNLCVKSSRHDL